MLNSLFSQVHSINRYLLICIHSISDYYCKYKESLLVEFDLSLSIEIIIHCSLCICMGLNIQNKIIVIYVLANLEKKNVLQKGQPLWKINRNY